MSQHFYSPKHLVTVDECPSCGGYWLDPGELAQIRAGVASSAEWHRATEEILRHSDAERDETEEPYEEPRPWWRVFTFLRPGERLQTEARR